MPAKKSAKRKASKGPGGAAEVDAFLRASKHPLVPVVEAVRRAVLDVDPAIEEGVKWNSASFHFTEWFATAGVRAEPFVRVVFHRGAKAKDGSADWKIDDPDHLLEWHAPDRASAKFHDVDEVSRRRIALQDVVRQWIRQMGASTRPA